MKPAKTYWWFLDRELHTDTDNLLPFACFLHGKLYLQVKLIPVTVPPSNALGYTRMISTGSLAKPRKGSFRAGGNALSYKSDIGWSPSPLSSHTTGTVSV